MRTSGVPLLPISPAVRSQRPTDETHRRLAGDRAAQSDLEVVRMGTEHEEIKAW